MISGLYVQLWKNEENITIFKMFHFLLFTVSKGANVAAAHMLACQRHAVSKHGNM